MNQRQQKLNDTLEEIQAAERRKQKHRREHLSQSVDSLMQTRMAQCELFCAGGHFSIESHRLEDLVPVEPPTKQHALTDRTWKTGKKKQKYRPLGTLVKVVRNRQRMLYQ